MKNIPPFYALAARFQPNRLSRVEVLLYHCVLNFVIWRLKLTKSSSEFSMARFYTVFFITILNKQHTDD